MDEFRVLLMVTLIFMLAGVSAILRDIERDIKAVAVQCK